MKVIYLIIYLHFDLSCKLHFESLNGNYSLDQVALSMCLLWFQGCHKNQIHGLGSRHPLNLFVENHITTMVFAELPSLAPLWG